MPSQASAEGERLQKVLARPASAAAGPASSSSRRAASRSTAGSCASRACGSTSTRRSSGSTGPAWRPPRTWCTWRINKPKGVVSTMSDPEGRPSVGDYVEGRKQRLFHVGRLDADTEGLILLTNDGELGHRLTHPSHEVPKTYLAEIPAPVPRDLGRRLREGVELDDGPARVDALPGRLLGGRTGPGRDHPARGPQPHRPADARRRRPPGGPARPDHDRPGQRSAISGPARSARSTGPRSASSTTRSVSERENPSSVIAVYRQIAESRCHRATVKRRRWMSTSRSSSECLGGRRLRPRWHRSVDNQSRTAAGRGRSSGTARRRHRGDGTPLGLSRCVDIRPLRPERGG